jgi:hypothetical protein
MDASEIAPGLWQGSFDVLADRPALAAAIPRLTTIVFCARELQPRPLDRAHAVEAVACPLDDARPTIQELELAARTARKVARRVGSGEAVLVTCRQGRNRSGLVVAMALHVLYGWGGRRAVKRVQDKRANALSNPYFTAALATLRPRSTAYRTSESRP